MTSFTPTPAFIVYDNRSGSTLLSALLNRYRGVSVSQECDFVFRILEHPLRVEDEPSARVLLEALQSSSRVHELGLDWNRVLDRARGTRQWSKRGLIMAIAREYFESRDAAASVQVIKSPRLHYHLGTLSRWWPEAMFVHIVRDGRAVFASKSRSVSSGGHVMDDNLVHAAATWTRKLALARVAEPQLVTIRYEDLVGDPEAALRPVLDRFALPESERTLVKAQDEWAREIVPTHQHIHTNVAKKPRPELADAWKETLHADDVVLYEMLAGSWLERMGYGRLYADPGTATRARARLRQCYYVGRLTLDRARHVLRLASHPNRLVSEFRRKLRDAHSR